MTDTILIKPKLVNSATSYWAMFYYAILKTVANQKNIKYPLIQPSLESYRGVLKHPANFFHQMRSSLRNHGFEYLMIDFLRSQDGSEIFAQLTSSLLQENGINDFDIKLLNIFKLGSDSLVSKRISGYKNPDVKIFLPGRTESVFERKKAGLSISYSSGNISAAFGFCDLFIMVSDGAKHTYGFVGEVEGQHGERLFREDYWGGKNGLKSKFATFALGASDRKKNIEAVSPKGNIVLHRDASGRWVVHFSDSSEFIKDFTHAISNLELCLGGHSSNIRITDKSHESVLALITKNWGVDKEIVFSHLEQLIDYSVDTHMFYYQNDIEDLNMAEHATYSPSLIALEDEFFLHKKKDLE